MSVQAPLTIPAKVRAFFQPFLADGALDLSGSGANADAFLSAQVMLINDLISEEKGRLQVSSVRLNEMHKYLKRIQPNVFAQLLAELVHDGLVREEVGDALALRVEEIYRVNAPIRRVDP